MIWWRTERRKDASGVSLRIHYGPVPDTFTMALTGLDPVVECHGRSVHAVTDEPDKVTCYTCQGRLKKKGLL